MTQRILALLVFFVAFNAYAKLEYDLDKLRMMNSDQINELVKKKIKKAQDFQAAQEDDENATGIEVEPEALHALKGGLRIGLSRPYQPDGARTATFTAVRRELADLNAVDKIFGELVSEAIDALKSRGAPNVQATYIVLLENLMAEIRPDLENNPGYKGLVEQIAAANIEVPSSSMKKVFMRNMSKPVSPSDTAKAILGSSKGKKK